MTNKEAIKIINNMTNYKPWEVEALYMAIKALEQTRWIPVSEKPQEDRYLCTYEYHDGRCVDFGSFDGEEWYIKPIAYMPIPEPYKAEEKR